MAMDALAIAAILRELAVLVRLDGDEHRARAYERAATTVEASHDVERRAAAGTLTELPNIGASIAATIGELHGRGTTAALDRLRQRYSPVMVALAAMREVGALRARSLVELLQPADLDDVAALAEAGRVRSVKGFGRVSEAKLLAALRGRAARVDRRILADARRLSGALASYLGGDPAAIAVHEAGPVRRWLEVVDCLALVVITRAPAAILERVRCHSQVAAVKEGAGAPALITLADGGRCELHLASPGRGGLALLIATGSIAHVAAMRARAAAGGVDLEAVVSDDEAAVYAALGLPWLPPEIRDGDDELARAAGGERFDDLVTVADIRGAVHCHTTSSDGKHSIAQMAEAAEQRGLAFLTITDHSATAHYAGGLSAQGLVEQAGEIAAAQADTSVRLLRGTEADILVDGELDLGLDVLRGLDVVIASIHERHRLDREAMTRRLVTAMRQPIFKIWGHALGRMLLRREPIDVDVDAIFDAILDGGGAAIELNGSPHRLDLEPGLARRAAARGIRFVVSTDAHSTRELDYLEYGVALARRARLRPADVLNTRTPDEFAAAIRPAGPR